MEIGLLGRNRDTERQGIPLSRVFGVIVVGVRLVRQLNDHAGARGGTLAKEKRAGRDSRPRI